MKITTLAVTLLAAGAIAQNPTTIVKVPREPSLQGVKGYTPLEVSTADSAPGADSGQRPDASPLASEPAPPPPQTEHSPAIDQSLDPAHVLFDRPIDGELWAAAARWKAGFDGTTATFVPFLGSDAERNYPAAFTVEHVTIAGDPVAFRDGRPTEQGGTVSIPHGAFVEQYATSPAGLEQKFVFAELPRRGELSVTMKVAGDYVITPENGGYRFTAERGGLTYGRATAIDARGRAVAMTSSFESGQLRLTVPAAFVDAAALPLTIDPMITPWTTFSNQTVAYTKKSTDVAFDASMQQFVVCWERVFSQTDSDVLFVRTDADLQPLTLPGFIDISATSWRRCQVAGLNTYDKFLVVAECEQQGSPTFIAGRTLDAAIGTLGSVFDIEHGPVACSHPDVGGDPFPFGPVYWTVVYERHYSASDHDIVARQVQENSTLRGSNYTPIDTTTSMNFYPTISKSNGADGSPTTQRWCIAYLTDAGNQRYVHAVTMSWDGIVDPQKLVGPGNPILETLPQVTVSSPKKSSLGRQFLVAGTQFWSLQGVWAVRGIAMSPNGVAVTPWDWLTTYNWDNNAPIACCDGERFLLGHQTDYPNSGLVLYLAVVDTVTDAGGTRLEQRTPQLVDGYNDPVSDMGLCSKASGGATNAARQYVATWSRHLTPGHHVFGTRYIAVSEYGGAEVRATGCGNLYVNVPTDPNWGAIGTTSQLSVGNPNGLIGWAIGTPTNTPLLGCCGTIGTTSVVLAAGSSYQLSIPLEGSLVTQVFSFQAFQVGATGCFGWLELADTIDMRIR